MLMYHGSNIEIINIDLDKCKPYKDFGRGFYLTQIEKQAILMANRTSRIYSGKPVVTIYWLDYESMINSGIKVKMFNNPNIDWALFVLNNRNRSFTDHNMENNNHDNKFDVVIGPVANDDIALLFRTFTNGLIGPDVLLKGLTYKETNNQYSFHTRRAISFLKKQGARVYG